MVRGSILWVLVLVPLSCVGTPVPIPIPIQSKSLRITEKDGEALVTGLEGAAPGASELRVENRRTGGSQQTKVTAAGSFALTLAAQPGDVLVLEALGASGVVAGSLEATMPGAKLQAPTAQLSPPDTQGLVEATGTLAEGDLAVVAVPHTGQVASAQADKAGSFSVKDIAGVLAGDPVYVFATNTQGESSEHLVLMLSTQSACVDGDLDGYGRVGTDLVPCGTNLVDCNDAAAQVNPGQKQYFIVPISGAIPAEDFDYNCDGTEEKEHSTLEDCSASPTCDAHGWQTSVPECGQSGTWIQCSLQKATCMVAQTETRTQACR